MERPELALSLPIGMTVTSAMNAIAHAAECLYAQDSNPVPMAVSVVDTGGQLVAFERMDNTQTASVSVAQEKAVSAAMANK